MKKLISCLMAAIMLCGLLLISASAVGSNIATATPINFDQTYTGVIESSQGYHYYKFTLPNPGEITYHIESDEVSVLYVSLYNSSGISYDRNWCGLNSITGRMDVEKTFYFTAGTFYLRVERNSL